MYQTRKIDVNALAKSDPVEDIQTHTDYLLYNLELLKSYYPNLFADWDKLYELLRLACIYHDLGKLYPKFQYCIKNRIPYSGIPHGLLSIAFIDHKFLKKELNLDNTDLKLLYHAVAYHHDRKMPYENSEIENELPVLQEPWDRFTYRKLPSKTNIKNINRRYFSVGNRFGLRDGDVFYRFIILQGLLNRLDYAASAHVNVEYPNTFLEDALEQYRVKKLNSEWNRMQEYMLKNKQKNLIVIAQTGMGKTEAGLLWLGNSKGFFTLPLKSAINAIYARIINSIVLDEKEERVGILHSETYQKYLELNELEEEKYTEEREKMSTELYYTRTKQLSLPLTVCTLDQLFTFVFLYRGFELKLATLAYSKIIVDEVQMYSAELLAYLIVGLRYVTRMGGKFAILTATLPTFFIDLLKEQGIPFEEPRTFTNDLIRHSLKVIDKPISAEDIATLSQKYNGKKILIICNTVKSAVNLYNQLEWDEEKQIVKVRDDELTNESSEVSEVERKHINLFHSCFTKVDRAKKEKQILSMGQKDSTESGIWIATQVVEASLDIDFDLLFTELSDLNGLFQRMGRCYRKRSLAEKTYNCFIFTGGKKECSGVGKFINRQIYNLSKEALLKLDGVIGEKEKVELIKEVYTKEKLPEYYEEIMNNISYIDLFMVGEISKADAQKRFREIDTVSIIPRKVYKEHYEEISRAIKTLQNDFREIERGQAKMLKAKARKTIADYTVDISRHIFNNIKSEHLKINEYEQLVIAECDYNSNIGVIRRPVAKKPDFTDFSSHSF